MFHSVIVVEDHQIANHSLQRTMTDLGIVDVVQAYYCDDALMRISKRIVENNPFELMITDLSFEADGNPQRLTTGEALIAAARQLHPNLKVLVFSAEQKAAVVSNLFHRLGINGYVRKARRDAEELKAAIVNICNLKRHVPLEFQQDIRQKNAHNFSSYDITIISLLSSGVLQKNIPDHLQKQGIKPSGLSSMEKRLNQIKEALGFVKNEQLVAYCKDQGII
jgi:DNA-binding NarL/FixJ family response regulator